MFYIDLALIVLMGFLLVRVVSGSSSSSIVFVYFRSLIMGTAADDEWTAASRRNVKRMLRGGSGFVDGVRVIYVDDLDTQGKYGYGFIGEAVFIRTGVEKRQCVIEHELLHAADRRLGISKSGAFGSLVGKAVDFSRPLKSVSDWTTREFPGYNSSSVSEYFKSVEENKSYWLSEDELFVSLNKIRLYMLKKKIVGLDTEILPKHMSAFMDELRLEGTSASGHDFFPVLPYINMDNLKALNEIWKMI